MTEPAKEHRTQPAVVVTGGSRGIGLALATRFAQAGSTVVLVARDSEQLARARERIENETGERAVAVPLDVTLPDAAERLDSALANAALHCDVLVNCAGAGVSGPFAEQSPEEIARVLALNVAGLTRLMRHVLPAMKIRGRGGVINLASLGGYVPGPHQAVYYASKAYVISLSEAVARECAGSGVRVSVVAPGPVETSFHRDMGAEGSLYRSLVPSLSPERVARAAYAGYRLGRRVIVPGAVSTLLAGLLRLLPHPLTVPMVGWLLAPRTGQGRRKSPVRD